MRKKHHWLAALLVLALPTLIMAAGRPPTRQATTPAASPSISQRAAAKPQAHLQATSMPLRDTRPLTAPAPVGRIKAPAMTPPRRIDAPAPDLRGCLLAADSWNESYAPFGLYKIPMADGTPFEQTVPQVNAQSGGVVIGKHYYSTWHFLMMGIPLIFVDKHDLESGELVYQYNVPYLQTEAADLTYDATTGTVYGLNYNSTQTKWTLSTVDYGEDEVTVTKITDLDGDWNAIAADKDGVLYGIRKQLYNLGGMNMCIGSTLVKFNKETGEYEEIGETGYAPHYTSSATIDPQTNRMFWTVSTLDGMGMLCEVDLQTGEASELTVFPDGEKVVGLYVAVPAAAPTAPCAPENVTASFPKGSLTGTVTFDIPARLYGGDTASGPVTYTIDAGDQEAVATGQAAFGQNGVSAQVTLQTTGTTEFSVYLTNDGGDSPRATTQCFVGYGVPMTPANIHASHDGHAMTVTWDAVNASADGGYINPDDITYTVTELPSGNTVAQATRNTSVIIPMEVPEHSTPFRYTVTATHNGITSAPGRSNSVPLGAITPPYRQTFDDEESLAYFTVVDANNDGITWEYFNGEARVLWNDQIPMDDWMISAPLALEAGKAYHITADIRSAYTGFSERLEIKAGTSPDPAAMTITVAQPVDVADENRLTTGGYLVPQTTGLYHIGLHGISDPDMARLYLDNFTVTEGSSAARPAAPASFDVTADPDGEHIASITATAPATDIAGNQLPVLTKAELSRGGTVIHTWHNPAPGATLTYTDSPATFGETTYTFTAYNDAGEGVAATKSVFVGTRVPAHPVNVALEETDRPGYVHLSWDAIATDNEGNPINPAKVRYSVYGFHNGVPQIVIATGLEETELTFYAGSQNVEQFFLQYAVFGTTESGNGVYTTSQAIPYGFPHYGYHNSFANGETEMLLGTRPVLYGHWYFCTDETFGDIQAADGDNGFIIHEGGDTGWSGAFYTARISLEGINNPAITFWSFPTAANDENTIEVRVREYGQQWQTMMLEPVYKFGAPGQWHRVVVPIFEFAGKTIQVEFIATTVSSAFTAVDNLTVGGIPDYDMAVTAISAPVAVACGTEFDIDVEIANQGAKEIAQLQVDLYADGTKTMSQTCGPAALGASKTVRFTCQMPPLATGPVEFVARTVAPGDGDPDNDASTPVTVRPIHNSLPTVENLTATETDSHVKLEWTEPTVDPGVVCAVTETFENGAFGDAAYPGWTFVDEDGIAMGGFGSVEIPGITAGETPASFFVIDSSHPSLNPSFAPREGSADTKYLASVYNTENTAISDWLISPLLSGDAQTISFWARSYDESMPEQCQVLYSTTGTDLADFTPIRMFEAMYGRWIKYEFDVPAGATHFAVRSCAIGAFMFFIDDITYIPHGAVIPVLTGYKVYRDNQPVATLPPTSTSFTDTEAAGQRHTYSVTSLFDQGESRAAEIQTGQSAITPADGPALTIRGTVNAIVVEGANGHTVKVYTPDGRMIATATAGSLTRIPVQPGIYVVATAQTVAKVQAH